MTKRVRERNRRGEMYICKVKDRERERLKEINEVI